MNREHLLALAERCEAGAKQLAYEAEHAAEVLATRAGGDQVDPQQWADRQTAAAAAARQYAQGLRDQAAGMGEGDRPSKARIAEAEKVADAASLGGMLIDGRRLADTSADSPLAGDAQRRVTEEYQRAEAEAVEGSGLFEHVAEPGRVPFWQLGHAAQAQDGAGHAAADTPDDAGEQPTTDAHEDSDEY